MYDSMELRLPVPADIEESEVRRAKDGDAAVWGAWYDRYFPLLFRYVFARIANREEAEDLASQVFVRALESIGGYRYQGRPVLAWLYRIAHNLVADRLRRERRRQHIPLESLTFDLRFEDQVTARTELGDALNRLKEEQREIIVLRYLVAMSTREIAAILGRSESAVYSLQIRALASLRKSLGI